MEDKNIPMIKKLFECLYKGLTCTVTKSDYNYLLYNSISKIDNRVIYDIQINEEYIIYYTPMDFTPRYTFYKTEDGENKLVYLIEQDLTSISDLLSKFMTHLGFVVSVKEKI
jgi:hypothetical protein